MKVSVEPALFADLVSRAEHHTAGGLDSVLGGLLLEAEGDALTVLAFSRETSIRARMPADVAEPGRTLLPGKVLHAAAGSLAKRRDYLALAATEDETTLTCGASEMHIRAMTAGDFPALPEVAVAVGTVEAGDLRAAVAQVAPACRPDNPVKPEHRVIRIDIDGDTITWVGADNYRMAARVTPWTPAVFGTKLAAHLPVRALAMAAKDFDKGPVTLGVDTNLVCLSSGDMTVTVRQDQIEAYTANYKPRLAAELPTKVSVDTEPLVEAVRRVVLFAGKEDDVTLDFRPGEIGAHAGDVSMIGRGTDAVACVLEGGAMALEFQPPFLLDGLAAVHTDTLRIGLTGPGRYIVIASDDGAFKYLTLPLRSS